VTLALTVAEARTMHHALDLAQQPWNDTAAAAETAARHLERPQRASTPGTVNIEPTPAYAGLAVIAHAEHDNDRRLAIPPRPLIDAADIQ
jgi:hypothetical protein